jgi:hypothetical protein
MPRNKLRSIARPKNQYLEANMTESKVMTAPNRGDHVSSEEHAGIFEVVGVNSLMQTANIRLVDGSGPVIANISWTALKTLK